MSYTRTMQRAHARKQGSARTYQRGKRTARPNIASMLTAVEWPTRLVALNGRAFHDGGFEARRATWLDKFHAERASFRHAPNITRWMPQMAVGQIGPVELADAA